MLNLRRKIAHVRTALPLLCVALLAPLPAAAQVVHVDVSSVFDADVIVNAPGGVLDPANDDVDGADFAFVTAGAGTLLDCVPGLPNNGFFAATGNHPGIQLAYNNSDNDLNARRSEDLNDSYSFNVPPGNYAALHLFMTTGSGASSFSATLNYDSGAPDVLGPFDVPDWFGSPPSSGYFLISGRNRVDVSSAPECDGSPGAAIFGIVLDVDPARALQSVDIDRDDGNDGAIMNFFGATALGPDAVPTAGAVWLAALAALLLAAATQTIVRRRRVA